MRVAAAGLPPQSPQAVDGEAAPSPRDDGGDFGAVLDQADPGAKPATVKRERPRARGEAPEMTPTPTPSVTPTPTPLELAMSGAVTALAAEVPEGQVEAAAAAQADGSSTVAVATPERAEVKPDRAATEPAADAPATPAPPTTPAPSAPPTADAARVPTAPAAPNASARAPSAPPRDVVQTVAASIPRATQLTPLEAAVTALLEGRRPPSSPIRIVPRTARHREIATPTAIVPITADAAPRTDPVPAVASTGANEPLADAARDRDLATQIDLDRGRAHLVVGEGADRVVVTIKMHGVTVDVAMRANHAQLAAALGRSVEQLNEALHARGLALGDTSTSTSTGTGTSTGNGTGAGGNVPARHAAAGATTGSDDDQPPTPIDPRLRALA